MHQTDIATIVDRITRANGGEPGFVPVVDADPLKSSALPTPDSHEFFSAWEKKSNWKNTVTVRSWVLDASLESFSSLTIADRCILQSIELFRGYEPQQLIERISPTPLLMTIAAQDVLTPADLAIGAFARAREPKQLNLLPGGHFEAYSGPLFEQNAGTQVAFLKKWLVDTWDDTGRSEHLDWEEWNWVGHLKSWSRGDKNYSPSDKRFASEALIFLTLKSHVLTP
jgi:hypothetical protein